MPSLWSRDSGAETSAGAGPGKRKMIRAVVEDGGVMAAVSEERNGDAPRDGEEDVVHVMVPVDDQTSCNETRSK